MPKSTVSFWGGGGVLDIGEGQLLGVGAKIDRFFRGRGGVRSKTRQNPRWVAVFFVSVCSVCYTFSVVYPAFVAVFGSPTIENPPPL